MTNLPAAHIVRCARCGAEFEADRTTRKTCSDVCRKAAQRSRDRAELFAATAAPLFGVHVE